MSPFHGPEWGEISPGVHARDIEAVGLGYLEVVFGDDVDAELPLVMVIHGRGDTPRVPGGPFESLPTNARIIVPRGPILIGDGFGWLPVRVADGRTDLLCAGLRDVSARLAALVQHVRETRPTRGRTIVTGFSQGGMLTITLATHHPEVLGIGMSLAGWLPPPLEPGPAPPDAPPVRALHGTADERIPVGPSVLAIEHLHELGWDATMTTFEGEGHAMSDEMNALFGLWLGHALLAANDGRPDLTLRASEESTSDEQQDALEDGATDETPEMEAAEPEPAPASRRRQRRPARHRRRRADPQGAGASPTGSPRDPAPSAPSAPSPDSRSSSSGSSAISGMRTVTTPTTPSATKASSRRA